MKTDFCRSLSEPGGDLPGAVTGTAARVGAARRPLALLGRRARARATVTAARSGKRSNIGRNE